MSASRHGRLATPRKEGLSLRAPVLPGIAVGREVVVTFVRFGLVVGAVHHVRLAGGGSAPLAPAPATASGRIVAFQEEKAIQAPYDRLFLRPEPAGGLAPGQVVDLYRPGEVRDGTRLPDEEIGRALVVRVDGELAAAVLFELSRSDLAVGDRFRPPRTP